MTETRRIWKVEDILVEQSAVLVQSGSHEAPQCAEMMLTTSEFSGGGGESLCMKESSTSSKQVRKLYCKGDKVVSDCVFFFLLYTVNSK